MSFDSFMKGVQQAEREHSARKKETEDAEDRKIAKQKLEIEMKNLKLQEAIAQRDIQKMTPGGPTGQATTVQPPMIQPPAQAPAGIEPPQTSPQLGGGIQDLLMKIRQQPVAAQPMPIGNPQQAESVETGMPPAFEDIATPYGNLPGTNKEIEAQRGIDDFLKALKMKGMEESQKAGIQREANTYTVTDPTTGQTVSAPKEILDNLLTQTGQNARQSDQQAFSTKETEKRLAAESEQRRLDRESRENIAQANRLQRAAQAGQTQQQARTNQQAMTLSNRFDTNPIVKNYAILKEALSFVESLAPDSKNPGDDIGLIYAFAKAMDPNSVVREGEYATVQKYIQSWAEKFGFDVKRVYSNTQFLSPESKANMKATIAQKVKASEGSYSNLRKETEKKFKNIKEDPTGWITDYGSTGPSEALIQANMKANPGMTRDQVIAELSK